jgi:hypothetical protein
MSENINLNKILQYVAQTIAIYLIFKYIPSQSINNRDIIIITIIITLFCILVENISYPSNAQKEQICSTICSNKKTENMTSLNTPQENINTTQENINTTQENINTTQENINTTQENINTTQENINTTQENVNTTQENVNTTQEINNISIDYNKIKQQSDILLNNKLTELSNLHASEEDNYYSSLFPATYYKLHVSENIERVGSRAEEDLVRSNMPYNDYNHLPISKDYVSLATDYGYSFLPPEKWYPEPPFPPVCVTEKRCPVVPLYTTGTNINLKDWDNSRRVTPPDNINTKFVKEVLNSGK